MKRLAALVAIILIITAGVASADSIDGAGTVTDDWGDNHTISNTGTYDTGNIVGVWQGVLWADGKLAGSGCSYVDGLFGGNTETATVSWQQGHFPSQPSQWDGIVGSNTWGAADNYLGLLTGSGVRYYGTNHNLTLNRASSIYTWTWNSASRTTGHPTPALGC